MNDYDDFFTADPHQKKKHVKDQSAAALAFLDKMKQDGLTPRPACSSGKAVAKSFWGAAWCRNVNVWSDYLSRLPAGRSLLKNRCVLDLQIEPGIVNASVFDRDSVHQIKLFLQPPEEERLSLLKQRCAGKISSLVDLLSGNLSDEILQFISDPACGLFPEHHEIRFSCDCFDDAVLCRHAAAALYGIGPRLDDDPALFFTLRSISPDILFSGEINAEQTAGKINSGFSDDDLSDAFGIKIGF